MDKVDLVDKDGPVTPYLDYLFVFEQLVSVMDRRIPELDRSIKVSHAKSIS